MSQIIDYQTFLNVEIRVGTVTECKVFKEARKPAFQLWVDFGPDIGQKKSSVQITQLYTTEELIGKQVIAVINFEPKQIGPFRSEILVLGLHNSENFVSLVSPDHLVPNGTKLL